MGAEKAGQCLELPQSQTRALNFLSCPASCPQRLKTGQPVIDAVREGLHSLDSRAVAALLKELSKSGQPQRASGAPALACMA